MAGTTSTDRRICGGSARPAAGLSIVDFPHNVQMFRVAGGLLDHVQRDPPHIGDVVIDIRVVVSEWRRRRREYGIGPLDVIAVEREDGRCVVIRRERVVRVVVIGLPRQVGRRSRTV